MKKIQQTPRQRLSTFVRGIHTNILRLKGNDIGEHSYVARSAHTDGTNPKGVHIGHHSRISVRATVLAHDYFGGRGNVDTYIGHHTVIGGQAWINPGLKIGNHVVVGACSVVTKDIPDHCMVAGNPAKIIKEGIELDDYYRIVNKGHKVSSSLNTLSQSNEK